MNRFIGVLAAAVLASACATAPRLSSAPALSRAKGTVSFKPTLYKGTKIALRIENLKDPEKLDPPGYSYVAWVQSERESPPQNVGALVLDPDLNGVLKTATPLHEFEFFVTAETSSDAAEPTGPPLFWIHKDREMTVTADAEKPTAALGAE